ncbi:hypothetical protein V6N12_063010 [Hibiscus sabdariffa]|uniref:Uncharacterized protein n=1 Tax=Hibiscus sabdariffa TaxID=183260 RepID=A0ABR2FAH8_9ROSI
MVPTVTMRIPRGWRIDFHRVLKYDEQQLEPDGWFLIGRSWEVFGWWWWCAPRTALGQWPEFQRKTKSGFSIFAIEQRRLSSCTQVRRATTRTGWVVFDRTELGSVWVVVVRATDNTGTVAGVSTKNKEWV